MNFLDIESTENFQQTIQEALSCGLVTEPELAERFGTSLSGIERWKQGRNVPHPMIRNAVFNFIRGKIT